MAYDIHYQPPDILIPIARKVALVMNPFVVPYSLRGQVSGAVTDPGAAREIGHAFGRTTKVDKPFLVQSENATAVIMTEGVTEAAELEDLALEALDRQTERAKGDFGAEQREKRHMPRREDFDRLYRDALDERVARHKRNPVTDPARQPRYADKEELERRLRGESTASGDKFYT